VNLKVTVLGSGTSSGVPVIGCACAVCTSSDPRDRRTRPSIVIQAGDSASHSTILVDTSTDLRAQALANRVTRVDAILFTHSHADHVMGLDEVRIYNFRQRTSMPCFGDARTLDDIRRMFGYAFEPQLEGGGIPQIALFPLLGPFSLGGVEVVPVPLMHGSRPILGYRVGSFAYLTDCNRIPDESWPLIKGVRTLVLDALRERPHTTHFNIAQALEVVEQLAPERTYFTHICHDLPHQATNARLPAGVELAYDGLVLEIGEAN
jgi:phosphoribosyl 1,2-cyclic phosphate phosphodiesterase